jgi:sulfur carrier protein ThiS
MISITIELMAAVRNPFPNKKRKNTLSLNSNLSVRDLLKQVGFLEKEIEVLIPIVNKQRASMDHELNDGDHLWITFPLGGGSI